jgi:hypothetical protein
VRQQDETWSRDLLPIRPCLSSSNIVETSESGLLTCHSLALIDQCASDDSSPIRSVVCWIVHWPSRPRCPARYEGEIIQIQGNNWQVRERCRTTHHPGLRDAYSRHGTNPSPSSLNPVTSPPSEPEPLCLASRACLSPRVVRVPSGPPPMAHLCLRRERLAAVPYTTIALEQRTTSPSPLMGCFAVCNLASAGKRKTTATSSRTLHSPLWISQL